MINPAEMEALAEEFREAMRQPGAGRLMILPNQDPPAPNESEWVRTMRALLGKHVVVTLNDDASAKVRGVLLAFTDMGEVCVLHPETGETTWAWPNLHVVEVAPQCAVEAAPRPVPTTEPVREPSRWFSCPHGCGEMLARPPSGDREDAMRPHLSRCLALRGGGTS